MNIRILGYKDAAKYKKIRLEALYKYPTYFGSSYESEQHDTIQEIEQRLRPQTDKFTLGAFDGEQLIGVVSFNREMTAKLDHKGYITGVFVTEKARGKGVARLIFEELFRLLGKNNGVEQLHLGVGATNETAIAFYESLQFKCYALEKQSLKVNGDYYDEVWMVKNL